MPLASEPGWAPDGSAGGAGAARAPGDSRPVEKCPWLLSRGGPPTALPAGRGAARAPGDSEHPVRVGGGLRDSLEHVPVLHHLARLVEPEDVDSGPLAVAWPLVAAV